MQIFEKLVNSVSIGTNGVLSMCVVPAGIRHDETDKELIAFTVLDTCSQGMFTTEDLIKKLNSLGTKTSINIKNLTRHERQSSHIKMSRAENEIQIWMKLAPAKNTS